MKNDLDLGNDPNFYIPYFAAEFDGNGHQISNLSFASDFVSCVGLFGYLAHGGKVTQLDVGDINIIAVQYVGGLVGGNAGDVNNSYATGNVIGNEYIGGVVGHDHDGTVGNSFWDKQTSETDASAGGTGKTTTDMMTITTYTDTATEGLNEPWDITAVDDPNQRNPAYIWNIVDGETYPFLSW